MWKRHMTLKQKCINVADCPNVLQFIQIIKGLKFMALKADKKSSIHYYSEVDV